MQRVRAARVRRAPGEAAAERRVERELGRGRRRHAVQLRLLLLGETIGAAEALDWGFLERVVPAGALDAALAEWLAHLGAAGRQALRLQKALIRRWEELPASQAIAAGIPAFAAAWAGDEPRRMMRAFLDRPRAGPPDAKPG